MYQPDKVTTQEKTPNEKFFNWLPEKDQYKSFFNWLFDLENTNNLQVDKNPTLTTIDLQFDEDPTFIYDSSTNHKASSMHTAPLICYPQKLKTFFNTYPMQRLKRILQLAKFMDNNANALHTRYEHSMGVYNNKLRIIYQKYAEDPSFKKYVETNHLKLHLIAELIKSAAHDIGHLPLSHVLELSVIQNHGFHEEIGKRILLENEEIHKSLMQISPKLPEVLKAVLEHDYFGFSSLDEGAYDVDRFDYLYRDLAHCGYQVEYKPFAPFKLVKVQCENSTAKQEPSGKIIRANDDDPNYMFIPVFSEDNIAQIEEFLQNRLDAYRDISFHPITTVRESAISIVLNKAIESNEPNGKELQNFLTTLKNIHSASDVDLNEWLQWDDLTFYNQLADIAEFSNNQALQDSAIFALPGLEQLLDISVKMLGIKNRENKPLSNNDKKLLHRLKIYLEERQKLTYNNNSEEQNSIYYKLSDPNYFERCAIYTCDPHNIEILKEHPNLPVNYATHSLVGYNPKDPLYFETKKGEIYTYDHIPERSPKISTDLIETNVAFCLLPFVPEESKEYLSNMLNDKRPKLPTGPIGPSDSAKHVINATNLNTTGDHEER